jgi:hypothetical protein
VTIVFLDVHLLAGSRSLLGARYRSTSQVICVVRWLPWGHGAFRWSGPAPQPAESLLQESERLGD